MKLLYLYVIFFLRLAELFTTFILLKHGRIPFNERASQYRQDFHSIVCTSGVRWMDRCSRKGSRELWKCSEKSFRPSSFGGRWTKKEASKFWHWKKTSEMGKAVNNNHSRYVNMMSRISLGFLAYILVNALCSLWCYRFCMAVTNYIYVPASTHFGWLTASILIFLMKMKT